jgi:environmental stress-induced protein Ves
VFDIKIIKKEQQQTNAWSGGTTTQIAIYPEDSSYTDRDFLWRLSSAVVELEESDFTKLPGFDRHLMVLEGELKLVHKEHHSVFLTQYEQDSFKGSWDTVSFGRARDFNLMLKDGTKGRLEQYDTAVGQKVSLKLEKEDSKQRFLALYCHVGEISIEARGKFEALEERELLLISCNDNLSVVAENSGNKECSLIAVFIEV